MDKTIFQHLHNFLLCAENAANAAAAAAAVKCKLFYSLAGAEGGVAEGGSLDSVGSLRFLIFPMNIVSISLGLPLVPSPLFPLSLYSLY